TFLYNRHTSCQNSQPKSQSPIPGLISSSMDPPTSLIYTLSLHDALPISEPGDVPLTWADISKARRLLGYHPSTSLEEGLTSFVRSEEHTSELQSPCNLVCRLLLEKKNRTAWRGSALSHESAHDTHPHRGR